MVTPQTENTGGVPVAGEVAPISIADAIETALSVAGIHEPDLKAEGAEVMARELGVLLHLVADAFLCRRKSDEEMGLYDGLRAAIDQRERWQRFFPSSIMAGTMIDEFQYYMLDQKRFLTEQIEELARELSGLAPLVKNAREEGFNTQLVADFNTRCAELYLAREYLALIEAHSDIFDCEGEADMENEGVRLLWARFVEDGGVDEGARYK